MAVAQTRKIPLLDLRAQFAHIEDEIMAALRRVAETQQFILGPEVEAFEREVAEYSESRFAIGCASGSDALILSLMALDIGPGDAVLTVPYTFFATAGSIYKQGARPAFVDIESGSFNIDVAQVEAALDRYPNVRAIMPVHLFGGCADMDPLIAVARARGLAVIEDAAQAIGAEYRGRRAGSLSAIGCFSFFPTKNLGAFGDGGLVTTGDTELARKLRALRVHGSETKYVHDLVGINSRLDALQAAVLRVKLRYLDAWTGRRQENAALYRRLFLKTGTPVIPQHEAAYQTRHIYNQFVVRCPERDGLRRYLAEHGVAAEIYYPIPLHLQRCFAGLGYREGDFPVSEQLAREALALPIHAELSSEEIEAIAGLIHDFYSRA